LPAIMNYYRVLGIHPSSFTPVKRKYRGQRYIIRVPGHTNTTSLWTFEFSLVLPSVLTALTWIQYLGPVGPLTHHGRASTHESGRVRTGGTWVGQTHVVQPSQYGALVNVFTR
jgi:ABC-type Fe3+ transport system permease subunit